MASIELGERVEVLRRARRKNIVPFLNEDVLV
jgi:hypothetical protein